jgi:hypothetical protein
MEVGVHDHSPSIAPSGRWRQIARLGPALVPDIPALRQAISRAAAEANAWFCAATSPQGRETYLAKGKLGDDGSGAVYVYFDENNVALYVGEAGRPIKKRMHDQTSPHTTTEWWDSWTSVRFLQIQDRTDRLTLELLLILAMKPKHNSKPGPREFDSMFADLRLSKSPSPPALTR